jgi:hypothetical protein
VKKPPISAFHSWFKQNIVNFYSKNVPATVLFLLEKLEIEDDNLSLFLKNLIEAANYIPLSVQMALEKSHQSDCDPSLLEQN